MQQLIILLIYRLWIPVFWFSASTSLDPPGIIPLGPPWIFAIPFQAGIIFLHSSDHIYHSVPATIPLYRSHIVSYLPNYLKVSWEFTMSLYLHISPITQISNGRNLASYIFWWWNRPYSSLRGLWGCLSSSTYNQFYQIPLRQCQPSTLRMMHVQSIGRIQCIFVRICWISWIQSIAIYRHDIWWIERQIRAIVGKT